MERIPAFMPGVLRREIPKDDNSQSLLLHREHGKRSKGRGKFHSPGAQQGRREWLRVERFCHGEESCLWYGCEPMW